MDTEDEGMPPEEHDASVAEVNALRDLLGQIGDPDAMLSAGVVDADGAKELKAKKLAYTAALDAYGKGEEPDVPAIIEQMREAVAQPTQEETNAANIDFLLMTVGGDA